MDNPLILLLWLLGVLVGVGLALYVFKKPKADTEALSAQPRFGTRLASLGESIRSALGSGIGGDEWSQLSDTLLQADLGVETTTRVLEAVRRGHPGDENTAKDRLAEALGAEMSVGDRSLGLAGSPAVLLLVGVNGTGKTTTIAKLARWLMAQGKHVVLGAADTFRAAAGDQLKTWGDRLNARVVVGAVGADPASVAFDAVDAGKAAGADVVIIDTAGRLHGKANLMEELAKIYRVAGGENGVSEVLLVLDATSGQNGLAQVREFANAVPLTGIVLTKLDGTAKGGVVVAVERDLDVPVKFVGVGEGLDDLIPFDPNEFLAALLGGT